MNTVTLASITGILRHALHIPEQTELTAETLLLGAMPEFDSMAVVTIVTALEERFGFAIEDDELDAAIFESVSSLYAFVSSKLNA